MQNIRKIFSTKMTQKQIVKDCKVALGSVAGSLVRQLFKKSIHELMLQPDLCLYIELVTKNSTD
jgi:hypothetical protein